MRLDGRSGHEAGRELLTRACGGTLPEIRYTDRGKPYFADKSLHFSISHTKNHAFCAISSQNIGIDAEETDRKVTLRLADAYLSPTEKARYDEAPDKRSCLLRLWVLKEADAKRTGEGLRGYPNRTDFSPDDPRVREVDGCYVAILTEP